MANYGSKPRPRVKLKGTLPNTTSWIRVLHDGRIELEYYDRAAGAEDHFEGDVACMYRISASEEPRLYELLENQTRAQITDDRTMLHALRTTFRDA